MTTENRKRNIAITDEINRAKRVLTQCAEIENTYTTTIQNIIHNERILCNIYDDSKRQSNIKEKKRQKNISTKRVAVYHEMLLQEARTRWEALDLVECKRRESVKDLYLHVQKQYEATINNIIYTEAQAKLTFVNRIKNV